MFKLCGDLHFHCSSFMTKKELFNMSLVTRQYVQPYLIYYVIQKYWLIESYNNCPFKDYCQKIFIRSLNDLKAISTLNQIKRITFVQDFNHYIDFLLPQNVLCVTFGYWFNQPVLCLQSSVLHLNFGGCFNQRITNLPHGLLTLSFGFHYNQILCKLPETLLSLRFGEDYDQILPNLPPLLTRLEFGRSFNKQIPQFPLHLQYLKFGQDFDQELPMLPDSLTYLEFGDEYHKSKIYGFKKINKFMQIFC